VSVLTKVLVVLLTVSSIALSMLVVAAFSQQQNWKTSADDWEKTALAALAKERAAVSNAQIEQQRALAQAKDDARKIESLQAELAARNTRVKELELSVADSQNKLSKEQSQVTSMADENKILLAGLNKEKDFAARLAQRNSELERGNIDLTDRVKELTTSVEMARSQVRALQQQIAAMDDSTRAGAPGLTAATQIPGGPGIVEGGVPAVQPIGAGVTAVPIRGQVKTVKDNLASISIGSADGVVPGMTFLIYRRAGEGGKPLYLGTLRVTRVTANESGGAIEQAEGDIRPGDLARDEASFAMRG
jgi:multidrug efflux pump subunit AcrA (membrane-fusion protein)